MNEQPVLSHGAPIHGSQNVPVQPADPLVGRDADLDAVHLSLKAETAVLLHGPAGIGKTTLVAALAAGYAELKGGVVWLDVANDTLRSLVTRVARAYGLAVPRLDAEIDPACAAVRDVLRENQPLVVLDGTVQVEAVRDFVRECTSGVPLLVTHTSMVPGPWTPHEVTALGREAARSLLLHHAAGNLAEDSPELRQLRQVLEGHPLSIEVSARQIATGSEPTTLLDNLPDLPPGQKNRAMAVLMAAYRMLPSELQGMVMLLGAAPAGGASEELLSDVSGARPDVLASRLEALVAHGFARKRRVYDEPYYVMHSLVHEFAQAFLRGKKRLNTMMARYLQALPVYVRRHADELALEHYNRLSTEMPNVLGVAMYAAKNEKLDALRELLHPLEATQDEGFVALRRFVAELDWMHYLLDHPTAADQGILGTLAPPPVEPPATEASTVPSDVAGAGWSEPPQKEGEVVAEQVGEPDTTEAAEMDEPGDVEEAVVTPAAPVADLPDEASAEDVTPLDAEPSLHAEAHDAAEPETSDASGVTDVETVSEPDAEPDVALDVEAAPEEADNDRAADRVMLPSDVDTLERLGVESDVQTEPDAAISQYQNALEGYRADGNVQDELAAIEALAKLNLDTERYDEVLAYLDRGMTLAQEADNPQREGEMLAILGDLQYDLGRLEGAEMAYREAISALRPVEAWLDIGLMLEKLGRVYMRQRRVDDAIGMWQQALPIFENERRNDLLRKVLNLLGDVNMRQMNWSQSEAYYVRALETAQALGEDRPQFVQLSKLAHLMETSGRHDSATTFYQRALYFALTLDDPDLLGRTELALARLLVDDTRRLNRALQLLQAANELLPEDKEAQRLLNRVQKRHDRLVSAGVTLPAAEGSIEDYAQVAFEATTQLSDSED